MGVVVIVVSLVCLVAAYLTWLAGRLDRLTARCDAARSALDAQLVRRAAVAASLADHGVRSQLVASETCRSLGAAAHRSLESSDDDRPVDENALTRALRAFLSELGEAQAPETARLLREVDDAATRVGLARQFHNDAVRDTLHLFHRPVVRFTGMARRRPVPAYFDIDESIADRQAVR